MNCRHVENCLSAYLDGELTGAEMLQIRRHLSECPECAEEHEMLRTMKSAVSRLRTVAPPEHLAATIVAKLDNVGIPPYQRVLSRLFHYTTRKLSPVAAALAVSGVALAILAAGGQDRIVSPQPEMMATAPLHLQVSNVSFQPALPDTPYGNSKPLVIADHSEGSFTLADLPVR